MAMLLAQGMDLITELPSSWTASTARGMEAVTRPEAARMIIFLDILPIVMMVVVPGDGEEAAEDEGMETVTDAAMEAVSLAVLLVVHLELLLAQELRPTDGGIQTP